ncbi:hypothetical protein HELRODRAFT_68945, partial [Helobdella robusta]|uniref:Lipoyl-binding domain-containing protein n=1 Tax=Helobdella robusta TaxID=6412 RepID=T1FZM3_HELRO
IEVKMPSLSPTMNQGTIIKWHKKEGDPIIPGDVLCEIQTDKAVLGFEVEEEGVLAKILARDNSKDITVGTLIAIIADQNTDWKTVSIPTQQEKAPVLPATQPLEKVSTLCGPVVRNLLDQYHINPHQVPHTGPHDILVKRFPFFKFSFFIICLYLNMNSHSTLIIVN